MRKMYTTPLVVFVLSCFCLSCSGQSPGDLRLWRNGSAMKSYSWGRLQIYIGKKWSEICNDGFGKMEADVACHQLQFLDSVDGVGSGDIETDVTNLTAIGLSDVYCPTNDYLHLLKCSLQIGLHTCSGNGYTMLQCDSSRIWDTPYIGQIRLINGDYTSQGLAQVYCDRGWGNICTDYPFGLTEANTVCRQLGYTESVEYNHLYGARNYSAPVLLSDIQCDNDNEQCLGACRKCSERVSSYCYSSYYLTIECKFNIFEHSFGSNMSSCEYDEGGFIERPRIGEVRLAPPTDGFNGVAELYYNISDSNNTWSNICYGSTNDQTITDTICTQLGYTGTMAGYSSVSLSSSSSEYYVSVSCSQNYPHLFWCNVSAINSCSSVLMVSCNDNGPYYAGQVRLRGGDYPSEGRVEMYVYGVWSSLYATGNSYDDDAIVICKQLGYTGAKYYDLGILPGNGTIHISFYSACYSSTYNYCFSTCLRQSSFYNGKSDYVYPHGSDLSVNCTFNRTIAPKTIIGSESECEIEVPTSRYNSLGGIIAVIVISVIMFVACIVVIVIIFVSVACTKKAKRRARQRQSAVGPVSYNPQAPMGGAVYMVPVNQIPPSGILLVPPQANQVQHQQTTTDEEKLQTDEVVATSNDNN